MEVKELQAKIKKLMDDWDQIKGKKYTKGAAFAHLVEEVGELAQELVYKERSPEKFDREELEDAIGDIMVYVVLLASLYNIDVEELILKIMKKDRKRMEDYKDKF